MSRYAVILALAILGCGTERNATSSKRDAGVRDGRGLAGRDAGFRDAGSRDAGSRDAVVVDGSLAGTSLDGVILVWRDELVLCDVWLENGSLMEVAERQVEIRLPAQARMEPGDLQTRRWSSPSTSHQIPRWPAVDSIGAR